MYISKVSQPFLDPGAQLFNMSAGTIEDSHAVLSFDFDYVIPTVDATGRPVSGRSSCWFFRIQSDIPRTVRIVDFSMTVTYPESVPSLAYPSTFFFSGLIFEQGVDIKHPLLMPSAGVPLSAEIRIMTSDGTVTSNLSTGVLPLTITIQQGDYELI